MTRKYICIKDKETTVNYYKETLIGLSYYQKFCCIRALVSLPDCKFVKQ